jgi:hypothetical protein
VQIEYIIIGIGFVLIVLFRLARSRGKGAQGESRVARKLKGLGRNGSRVFNDVTIRTKHGSSQIDHVVISIYGIFVIETKNYRGWIHGNEKSEYWTQSIYKKKTKFRNPVRQNWSHVYALKEVLPETKKVTYFPIVVFSGNAELKNVYSDIPVIYSQQLARTIKAKSRNAVLSLEQVDNLTERLNQVISRSPVSRKDHIRQVKINIRQKKLLEKKLICPKCEVDLIVREGKYGKFYGCSNYPKCRYTRPY